MCRAMMSSQSAARTVEPPVQTALRQISVTAIFGVRRIVRSGYIACDQTNAGGLHMTITLATPLVSLLAGILILLVPRLLNYVVAIYLIFVGLVGLFA
jgi:hypothetical protein